MGESKIRVVHLVRALDVGGLERVVLDLVVHRSESIDARVICLEHRGEIANRFEAVGVGVEELRLEGASLPRRIWSLSRALRRLRPDVLHTHNSGPHVNGAVAAKLARVPVLVHSKHGRNYVNNPKKLRQNWLAAHLSSRIVAVSHDAAQVARELERVPDSRIEVIHNGIDLGRFQVNLTPFRKAGAYRAVHVARLNRVKDQATLLRAARLVIDRLPGFELDVIGDGPAREDVVALHEELGLEGKVHLHGSRDDVPDWLARADMFVLSSVSEGICLTLLEAMAVGLPIVATDVGGNSEVIEDGKTGILVPPSNSEAMSKAILAMCRNTAFAKEMGCRGRRRVEEHFDVRTMVARYEAVYHELLGRAAPIDSTSPVHNDAPTCNRATEQTELVPTTP